MRVAPVGLYVWAQRGSKGVAEAFELGREAAALTHGHPTGNLSAGVLAALVHQLLDGATLDAALDAAITLLVERDGHGETLGALQGARARANVKRGCGYRRTGSGLDR